MSDEELRAEIRKIRETFEGFVSRLDHFLMGAALAFQELLERRKAGK